MSTAQPATAPIAIKPTVDPNTGFVTVNTFDGTRQAMPQGKQILLTVRDGSANTAFSELRRWP
jgi:hypothetical protein